MWNKIHGDDLVVPTLEQWREITGLPWAAFWLRELLSWGTLEPVVAYLMAASSTTTVTTREEAERYVKSYYDWHQNHPPDARSSDDFFNPLHLAEWHRATFHQALRWSQPEPETFEAQLKRDFPGDGPETYSVLPCELGDLIAWLDAAGYWLAESEKPPAWHERSVYMWDFSLNVRQRLISVQKF
jgi:hypothetical protein